MSFSQADNGTPEDFGIVVPPVCCKLSNIGHSKPQETQGGFRVLAIDPRNRVVWGPIVGDRMTKECHFARATPGTTLV